jgi:mannose-6-phosphate isomerase
MNKNFISSGELYPLLFKPIYVERMWGGTLMSETLGRNVPDTGTPIGESWELSDRDDAASVVENGPLAGFTLGELVKYNQQLLLGKKYTGGRFPLLVKLIDAGDRLSLQVHPDESACAELGGGAEPKTEMWYIISSRSDGTIMAGLSPRATRQQLIEKIDSCDVEKLLQVNVSIPGDAYFIPSGTLHAIGAGNLILEIQQNSDTTYRASDWGRVDASGKPRELHLDKALASIDFRNRSNPRVPGVSGVVSHNRKLPLVSQCRFFAVDDLHIVSPWQFNTANESFHLLTPVSEAINIYRPFNNEKVTVEVGRTVMIPANYGEYIVESVSGKVAKVIKSSL